MALVGVALVAIAAASGVLYQVTRPYRGSPPRVPLVEPAKELLDEGPGPIDPQPEPSRARQWVPLRPAPSPSRSALVVSPSPRAVPSATSSPDPPPMAPSPTMSAGLDGMPQPATSPPCGGLPTVQIPEPPALPAVPPVGTDPPG